MGCAVSRPVGCVAHASTMSRRLRRHSGRQCRGGMSKCPARSLPPNSYWCRRDEPGKVPLIGTTARLINLEAYGAGDEVVAGLAKRPSPTRRGKPEILDKTKRAKQDFKGVEVNSHGWTGLNWRAASILLRTSSFSYRRLRVHASACGSSRF